MSTASTLLAAEAPNNFWLPGDINEVYWGSLAFLVLVVLLWKFAKDPTVKFFTGRVDKIRDELDEAAALRAEAEAETERIKAALADSDAEAARIIEEARRTADQLSADIAARTEADVAAVHERAAIDLAATRAQAQSDLAAELSRLSLGAAERVVESSLDDSTQQRLIDDYIGQVGAQN